MSLTLRFYKSALAAGTLRWTQMAHLTALLKTSYSCRTYCVVSCQRSRQIRKLPYAADTRCYGKRTLIHIRNRQRSRQEESHSREKNASNRSIIHYCCNWLSGTAFLCLNYVIPNLPSRISTNRCIWLELNLAKLVHITQPVSYTHLTLPTNREV